MPCFFPLVTREEMVQAKTPTAEDQARWHAVGGSVEPADPSNKKRGRGGGKQVYLGPAGGSLSWILNADSYAQL